jgi:hypothetical protein
MSMLTVRVKKDLSGLDVLDKQLPGSVDACTFNVASAIVEKIHQNWSENSPSAPGQPPAVVTGNLDRSVIIEKQGRSFGGQFASGKDASMWIIRIGAEYAGILEEGSTQMLARPFVLPAVLDTEDELPDFYKDVFNILW